MPFHSIVWSQGATTHSFNIDLIDLTCSFFLLFRITYFQEDIVRFVQKLSVRGSCINSVQYALVLVMTRWLANQVHGQSPTQVGVRRAWNLHRRDFDQVGIHKVTPNRNHSRPNPWNKSGPQQEPTCSPLNIHYESLWITTIELLAMASGIVSFCRFHCFFWRGCPDTENRNILLLTVKQIVANCVRARTCNAFYMDLVAAHRVTGSNEAEDRITLKKEGPMSMCNLCNLKIYHKISLQFQSIP